MEKETHPREEAWGFDPLAPMPFGTNEMDYENYVPPIVAPDPNEKVEAKPEPTARESIEALIKGMPGQEKLVLHVIDFCRQDRTVEELVDEIKAFQRGSVSVYSPETICTNLQRAKALEIAKQSASECEKAPESAEEAEFLQATPCQAFSYKATAAGIEVLEENNPAERIAALLTDDAKYLPVYSILLSACIPSEGISKKEVDALVDNHPLCKQPRRYSGHFIKKLESMDALVFDGRWHITEIGAQLLTLTDSATTAR